MSTSLELPFEVPIEPGLMIVHGNRLEDLRDLLTAWLGRAPLHPLENELMLVQSNGIAQWLKLALARSPDAGGLGISAAVDVQLPGRFLWAAYRAVLGRDTVPPTSPFDKSRLTWRLLRLIPQHLHDADFVPLKDFLGTTPDWNKKFQLAERIADLFDQYQVYRADWLADWQAQRFVLRDELRDRVTPLPNDQRWQVRLWRLLLDDVGAAECHSHRAAIHQAFLQRIQTISARPAALPRRIVVFGISSLPQQTLEALTALAQFSQILLIVANPCRHYWADIIEDRELLKASQRRQLGKPGLPAEPRYEDLHLHANPLLAAWGKQGRDYIRLLDAFDQPEHYRRRFTALNRSIDLFTDIGESTLLQQVQQAILDLEPLPAEPEQRKAWHSGDDSLRFHIAHNPQREVEILHDQLLALFEQAAREGRPLAPRDVIVMVPDIRSYAPHVRAVFGRLSAGDPRHLPYTVADQPARGAAPLIVALEHLLALPESRFAVSEILDLLDVPALRLRFGVKETDLPTLRRWIDGAGIRWGFDGAQIESLQLPALEQNSWVAGLRRMLLGYAVGDSDMPQDAGWHDIAPYSEIGGLDAAMLGPLSLLLEQLEHYWQLLRTPASPKEWSERLRALLADHFKASESEDDELLNRLHDALDAWQQACDQADFIEAIPLATVRDHWLAAIDESRLSQRFMGGAVSFGTLMPMRAIPFRVVCLLGMNDGDYPRRQTPVDFDLMALPGHARPGDRSRREDDRYLFLEALLSARDALHISWVGHSARDNSDMPPSVLVGQLRDYLAAGWHAEKPLGDLLAALTTEYPLQPFSRRYFGMDDDARVFTYANEWQLAHRAPTPTAMVALAPWQAETALNLGQLQSFLSKPVRYFFNHRLKVHFSDADVASADEEPFALDGLQRYQARQEVWLTTIDADNTGDAIAHASRRLRNQGALPPGGFGELAQAEIANETRDLAAIWHAIGQLSAPVTDKYELRHSAHGLQLEDWLTDLRQAAHEPVQHTPDAHPSGKYLRLELINGKLLASGSASQNGKLRYDKLTSAWVIHLLANAQGIRMQTQLIAVDAQPLLRELSRADACAALDELLLALHQGMAAPLPLARKTAFAYLQAERDEEDPLAAARLAYDGDAAGYRQGELQEDAYLARAWPRFDALLQAGFIDCLAAYRRLVDAAVLNGGEA
ncbi:exodeoxyribonuclease V subunit gamma [Dyella silvatica]|uniref:exodeoxyribonuclease V subunit gamma n=1 Tax=Dyella silvatica TaxID=2992128 RepID=UPI0022535E84|nr:exodeoxyribonuclease V subunit gamma [Dyella silvatica]